MGDRTCPVCGALYPSMIYKNVDFQIVGCDRCIRIYDEWEIDLEDG